MSASASRWQRWRPPFAQGAADAPAVSMPLVIAHRGASAIQTENTAAAFERARRDGADGVELDVLLCGSGEVVVFHDDDLLRLADRPERVADLSLRQLRQVRLPGETRIPTLDEAFEACGPELLVNVELKSGGLLDRAVPSLVAAVAATLDRCRIHDRVLVSSFDPGAIWCWQQARSDVARALLVERGAGLGLTAAGKTLTLPWLGALAIHPESVLCRPAVVAACHRGGYAVNTWTVDDPVRLRELRAMGIDGVISNDPAAARAALLA